MPSPRVITSVRGLTLIELTIAMGIVVLLFGAVVWSVGALTGAQAKQSAIQLAGAIRALYDSASLSGNTCRLVFHLPKKRDDEGAVSWRAECASGDITAQANRKDELRAADKVEALKDENDARFTPLNERRQPSLQELQERERERVKQKTQYASFSSEEVHEEELPHSVSVEVWTQKQHKAVKHGTAYLYFFPQGYTERAQVWLRQSDNVWTITIAPLTGKAVIHNEDLEVPRS